MTAPAPRDHPAEDARPARPEPVVAPLPSEALRHLAERGVGTDLTPTISPNVDVGWWYEYLRSLDRRWREEVARIADRLVPEDDEDTVRVLDTPAGRHYAAFVGAEAEANRLRSLIERLRTYVENAATNDEEHEAVADFLDAALDGAR